jgi:hypothetical protein
MHISKIYVDRVAMALALADAATANGRPTYALCAERRRLRIRANHHRMRSLLRWLQNVQSAA